MPLHPVNQALLVLLDNQVARTTAAFEGLSDAELDAPPGADCHTIRQITDHLLGLCKFQLTLLNSPLAAEAPPAGPGPVTQILSNLETATALLRRALSEHDPADWFATPSAPRPGPWGGDATLARLARPFNDFTNHLGAIRAIRRIAKNPAPRTQ